MRVHLVDGTYELFRQHFGASSRHGDRHPYAAAAGVVGSTLDARPGRCHPCRRRLRPRHRELPQRHVARLQDQRGHAPGDPRPDPGGGAGARGSRIRRVGDGRVRGRRRTRRGRHDRRRRRTGRTGADRHRRQGPLSVRRSAAGSSSSTVASARSSTRTASGRSSASGRRRSPTTSALSATPPTDSPACRVGAPRAPPSCSPGTATSSTSRRPPGSGMSPACAVRRSCRRRCRRTWPTPCCSAGSPPSRPTSRSALSIRGAGPARPTIRRRGRGDRRARPGPIRRPSCSDNLTRATGPDPLAHERRATVD